MPACSNEGSGFDVWGDNLFSFSHLRPCQSIVFDDIDTCHCTPPTSSKMLCRQEHPLLLHSSTSTRTGLVLRKSCLASVRSPRRHLALSAVLEKEEPRISSSQQQQQSSPSQKESLESLLPPSLASKASNINLPPRLLSAPEGEVFYFAFGANLALSTLKRRGVAPISRSPAVVLDPSVWLVFKHRGGECGAAGGGAMRQAAGNRC